MIYIFVCFLHVICSDGRYAFVATFDGKLLLLALSSMQMAYAVTASMQLLDKPNIQDMAIHSLSVKASDYITGVYTVEKNYVLYIKLNDCIYLVLCANVSFDINYQFSIQ